MNENWLRVRKEHILEALRKFDKEQPKVTLARSIFLLYEDRSYPAKHIRGMAYEIANGKPIGKDEYSGGTETAKFLADLGFVIRHTAKKGEKEGGNPMTNTIYQSAQEYDFRSLEIEVQRARLNFMKWLFYFTPPDYEVYKGSGSLNSFKLFQSKNGRTFSLLPCGSRSAYVGGRVELPPTCFDGPRELEAETVEIKKSITERIAILRTILIQYIESEKSSAFWKAIQDYYWIKLGLHEYVFDAKFYPAQDYERLYNEDVRGYAVKAMRMALDLGKDTPHKFGVKELKHALRYKLTWSRYAMCSFDCGPIAWGNKAFISFSEIAQQRIAWDAQHRDEHRAIFEIDDKTKKRQYAQLSLSANHHFEVQYDQLPLSDALQFDGFMRNRVSIRRIIESAQERINDLIAAERLSLRPFLFLPKG